MEKWKEIEGFRGYEVSNKGRIRSYHMTGRGNGLYDEAKILKPDTSGRYKRVTLYSGDKKKRFSVSRIVAKHFIENPKDKPEVNHIDGDTFHDHADNLEWVTKSENHLHAHKLGLKVAKKGEEKKCSKLTEDDVREIRYIYENDPDATQRGLAERYGLKTGVTIHQIVNRKTWKHI